MSDKELQEKFVQQIYGIFDHDETSSIWCQLCKSEAKPTQETGYDYRYVVHNKQCVVPAVQRRLGIEMLDNQESTV